MNAYGPWSREAVIDLHILILLIIWMTLDRSNIYVRDIWDFLCKLGRAFKQVCTRDFWVPNLVPRGGYPPIPKPLPPAPKPARN